MPPHNVTNLRRTPAPAQGWSCTGCCELDCWTTVLVVWQRCFLYSSVLLDREVLGPLLLGSLALMAGC